VPGLILDHLAQRRQTRAIGPGRCLPQLRAHQGLAALKERPLDRDLEHGLRRASVGDELAAEISVGDDLGLAEHA